MCLDPRGIVSAAVIDDVLSLMLLALLTGVVENGGMPSLASMALLVFKVIVFFIICTFLGKYLLPFYMKALRKGEVDEGDFGGLLVTFTAFTQTPVFLFTLVILAILGKMIGAGIPVYMQSKNIRESLAIGVAMNGRGAVELIIVDIALRADLFSYPAVPSPIIDNLYSAIVIMAIITTVMVPVCLKSLFNKRK